MATNKKIGRLCYVTGVPVVQRDGEFLWEGWSLRLHEGILGMFPEAILAAPIANGSTPRASEVSTVKLGLWNLKVCPLPSNGGRSWRNLRQLLTLWSAVGEADLVCLDVPNESSFLALVVCKLRRKHCFTRILGDWGRSVLLGGPPTLGRKIKTAIAEWMADFMVRQSPLVRVQGNELYEKYVKRNPAAVKASFVHSTLRRDVFHERDSQPFHQPLRLLSVSGLTALKGLNFLVEAIRLLAAKGLGVEWWCVGDGPCRQSLEDLARSLEVSDRVRFLGYVPFGPELFQLYKEADMFVHPSLTEGVPNALLEAMAHSLPVVASAVGGIPGVITNGVHGVLVAPGRPELIADAISRLAQDHELVIRLRRGAYAKAHEYSADVLMERAKQEIESTFGKIADAGEGSA